MRCCCMMFTWHKAYDDHLSIMQVSSAVCPLDMLKLDMSHGVLLSQVDLHGLHVEEALQVLQQHLLSLGGLGCPGGVLLQVTQMHLPGTHDQSAHFEKLCSCHTCAWLLLCYAIFV